LFEALVLMLAPQMPFQLRNASLSRNLT